MNIHCSPIGQWNSIQDKNLAKTCKIRLNPIDVLDSSSDKLTAFIGKWFYNPKKKSNLNVFNSITEYLSPMVNQTEISGLLESSEVVGNIRFSHPTLYVFPGGQGDAALFGINGFNMLGKFVFIWTFNYLHGKK